MLLEAAQRKHLVERVALSPKERIGNAESKQAEKIYTICDQEPEFDFTYPEQDFEVEKKIVSSHVSSLRLLLRLIWFTPNANEKGCENLKALVDFFKKYPGLRKWTGTNIVKFMSNRVDFFEGFSPHDTGALLSNDLWDAKINFGADNASGDCSLPMPSLPPNFHGAYKPIQTFCGCVEAFPAGKFVVKVNNTGSTGHLNQNNGPQAWTDSRSRHQDLSGVLRSSVLVNQYATIIIWVAGLRPLATYMILTVHHDTTHTRAIWDTRLVLQYSGHKNYIFEQRTGSASPMMHLERVKADHQGSALLMLRRVGGRRGHGEEREQHMNINAMLISLLPD